MKKGLTYFQRTRARNPGQSSAALVIVLCFVVLLTVVVLAMLSRSVTNGMISGASTNVTKVNLYAHGAINQIIGDLEQEIVAGSTATSTTGGNIYRPTSVSASVPASAGPASYASAVAAGATGNAFPVATTVWNTMPNLVKQSYHGVNFEPYDTSVPARAANAPSTTVSRNGRYVSLTRWNKALLLPKSSAFGNLTTAAVSGTVIAADGSTSTTPLAAFVAPDWILTAADGSNVTAVDTSANAATSNVNPKSIKYVVGRYAYTIYNEGGLLDANIAGCPVGVSATQTAIISRKGSAAFADLTQLPGISSLTPAATRPQQIVNSLVGWRNSATILAQGSGMMGASYFPNYLFGAGYTSQITNYLNYLLGISNNFMSTGNTALDNGLSDRVFTSRQQMINFFVNNVAKGTSEQAYLQDAMMYLGTFSRTLNQPSYWPDGTRPLVQTAAYSTNNPTYSNGSSAYGYDSPTATDSFNPPFKSIRVTGSFSRNDGTSAGAGEPLVKKRFALCRLMWLTYKGPSANVANTDALYTQYQTIGVPPATLSQLWNEGTAANIKAYFGLTWHSGNGTGGIGGYWVYDPDSENPNPASPSNGIKIKALNLVAQANREPNFFELLKASVCAGSVASGTNVTVGLDLTNPFSKDRLKADNRVDFQILQMGANIINQASPTNFPVNLVIYDTGGANSSYRSFIGVEDLPYLYGVFNLYVLNTAASPVPPTNSIYVTPPVTLAPAGLVGTVQVPVVWNPHATNPNALPANLAPTIFRVGVSNLVPSSIASPPPTTTASSFYYYFNPEYTYQTLSGTNVVTVNIQESSPYAQLFAPWSPNTTASYPYGGASTASINPTSIDANTGLLNFTAAANNTEIYFDILNNSGLYREPTALMYDTTGTANQGNVHIDSQNVMTTVGAFPVNGSNGAGIADTSGTNYIGFFECEFPYRWNSTIDPVTLVSSTNTYTYTVNKVQPRGAPYGQTYSLEYQSGSNWIPYMQYIVGQDFSAYAPSTDPTKFLPSPAISEWSAKSVNGSAMWDPRTQRWGAQEDVLPVSPNTTTIIASSPLPILQTIRPDGGLGVGTHSQLFAGASKDMYIQNAKINGVPSPFANSGNFIIDPDQVLRRPMGAYVPSTATTGVASTTVGLPMANVSQTAANGSNRPILLHRPFRSVAELGYVFSDTPWRNIDFFTPESGDSALLDVFCINEDYRPDAVSAGRVDLNTKQAPVIQSLLAGAYRDEITPGTNPSLVQSEAVAISQGLVSRTTGKSTVVGGAVATGPLSNIGDLTGRYTSTAVANANNSTGIGVPYDGFSADLGIYTGGSSPGNNIIQRFRESTMRALSDSGQAGTWNLLIDVVAQSGRYPSNAAGLSDFLVEGERRYWVHVAIDRSTGQVIDENIEAVNE